MCEWMSAVIAYVLCPSTSCTAFRCTPAALKVQWLSGPGVWPLLPGHLCVRGMVLTTPC